MRIVICDDEASRRDEWKRALEEISDDHEVVLMTNFHDPYATLIDRRHRARELRGSDSDKPVEFAALPADEVDWDTPFDDADVLLVDYDLFRFDTENYVTGSIVAYLARCYSKCGVIVSVNEFGSNPFDLTLCGDQASFADVTIGDAQIANPGLWSGTASGFRPWSWPPLRTLLKNQRERASTLSGSLDSAVIDATGLTGLVDRLPRSARAFLERAGQPGTTTSLAELARGARLGYRRGDEAPSQPAVARVASARAAKWLEHVVLPLQDVLIDAPHLAQRNPALIVDLGDVDSSLATTTRLPASHDDCGLVAEVLEYRHVPSEWLSRPAFRWPDLAAADEIPGVSAPWKTGSLDRVFCEDVSRFLHREHARRFVSDLDSNSAARWVADPSTAGIPELENVDYRPISRLAI